MSAGRMFCTKRYLLYGHCQKLYLASGQFFFPHTTVHHKECLNDVAMRTVRYSYVLSTAGTSILFSVSVNRTKHHSTFPSTSHSYEPGKFATFQQLHFNTTFPLQTASHKKFVLLKVRLCDDAMRYVYRASTFYILVTDEGETGIQVDLIIS
jgi:hypothetical protein